MRDPPNVAGRWAVTFTGKDGSASPAIAELTQQGARVVGTVLDPTGDHRFLEGEVAGRVLELSRFDGGSAFLYRAELLPTERWRARSGPAAGRRTSWPRIATRTRASPTPPSPPRRMRPERLRVQLPRPRGRARRLHRRALQGQGRHRLDRRQLVPQLPRRGGVPRAALRERHARGLEIVYLRSSTSAI